MWVKSSLFSTVCLLVYNDYLVDCLTHIVVFALLSVRFMVREGKNVRLCASDNVTKTIVFYICKYSSPLRLAVRKMRTMVAINHLGQHSRWAVTYDWHTSVCQILTNSVSTETKM